MKNHLILFCFVMVSAFAPRPCFAQITEKQPLVLDTIYANDQKNVALFFPEPIRQGITGSDNFVFTYNREKEQYFGLLQAKPGKESNLLVINRNGSVFSYIISYKQQLSRLNYFIPNSSSIGNEKPLVSIATNEDSLEESIDLKRHYYKEFCSYLVNRRQKIGRIKKRGQDIVLSVENIVFDKSALYFVIQIENKSTLDYDLNFLNLSLVTRQKGKKKSLQKLFKEPVLKYNLPSRIKEGDTARLVYVFPKFSLSGDRRAVLELNEKDGGRNLKLKISHRFINNPN
ncbi:DUF4138 domain-containing protein [Gramella sp. AN32]|uniref:DUF4138 domain-containing protein n=1 Tax=Christiangramia antarctica TaxID=2058158 RepID=A0ABW5XAH4_9FLAO|nr:DUF4138 domain-containing protein [Gramella sp. AN32]MCM4157595.1 conjugal transfer protein TraN [Gramella sp. AN32]